MTTQEQLALDDRARAKAVNKNPELAPVLYDTNSSTQQEVIDSDREAAKKNAGYATAPAVKEANKKPVNPNTVPLFNNDFTLNSDRLNIYEGFSVVPIIEKKGQEFSNNFWPMINK